MGGAGDNRGELCVHTWHTQRLQEVFIKYNLITQVRQASAHWPGDVVRNGALDVDGHPLPQASVNGPQIGDALQSAHKWSTPRYDACKEEGTSSDGIKPGAALKKCIKMSEFFYMHLPLKLSNISNKRAVWGLKVYFFAPSFKGRVRLIVWPLPGYQMLSSGTPVQHKSSIAVLTRGSIFVCLSAWHWPSCIFCKTCVYVCVCVCTHRVVDWAVAGRSDKHGSSRVWRTRRSRRLQSERGAPLDVPFYMQTKPKPLCVGTGCKLTFGLQEWHRNTTERQKVPLWASIRAICVFICVCS